MDVAIIAVTFCFVFVVSKILEVWRWRARSHLRPGTCECGHMHCAHKDGTGACCVNMMACPDVVCACSIYIFDPDADDGDDESTPEPDPSINDLENLYKK